MRKRRGRPPVLMIVIDFIHTALRANVASHHPKLSVQSLGYSDTNDNDICVAYMEISTLIMLSYVVSF